MSQKEYVSIDHYLSTFPEYLESQEAAAYTLHILRYVAYEKRQAENRGLSKEVQSYVASLHLCANEDNKKTRAIYLEIKHRLEEQYRLAKAIESAISSGFITAPDGMNSEQAQAWMKENK